MPLLEKKDSFVAEKMPRVLRSGSPWKTPGIQLGALLRQTTVAKREELRPGCSQLCLRIR